jgi:hypothetical protein
MTPEGEAAPAEGAEPEAVEGAEVEQDTSGGLYDLESVPEDLREHLEPHLKAIEGNATKKFQQAAEFRKAWEPYEQAGVNEYEPEAIGQLIQFAQMTQDPEQFGEWFKTVGEQQGLFERLGYVPADEVEGGGEFDINDPDQLAKLVASAVDEKVKPLYDTITRQQIEQETEEAYKQVQTRLTEIRGENPDLPEGAEDVIVKLAKAFVGEADDPIDAGFKEYQAILATGEKGLLAQKAGQPNPLQGPGPANTTPPAITADNVKAAAMERLKAANAA